MKKFWTVYMKLDCESLRIMKPSKKEAIETAKRLYAEKPGEYFIFEYVGTVGVKPNPPIFIKPEAMAIDIQGIKR